MQRPTKVRLRPDAARFIAAELIAIADSVDRDAAARAEREDRLHGRKELEQQLASLEEVEQLLSLRIRFLAGEIQRDPSVFDEQVSDAVLDTLRMIESCGRRRTRLLLLAFGIVPEQRARVRQATARGELASEVSTAGAAKERSRADL